MDPKKEKSKFKLFGTKDAAKPPPKERRTTRKVPDSPVAPPADDLTKLSEEEIEQKFVLMLEDMNLTQEQTKSLRTRPLAVKLEMLMSHQANLQASKNNDPEAFVSVLRNPHHQSNKQLLHLFDELHVRLRTSGVSWIRNFNNQQNDGLNLLLRILALSSLTATIQTAVCLVCAVSACLVTVVTDCLH
ncbi:hypothetical protein T265_10957 [Opisthorchis viverrini]|uniref:Formin GTPase-binding domain-containing protein n=1 Tax=Opisthorchis viverrini TaxID=6198 RepID=A0A074Z4Q2_OPIVI|nr:hypothetical protein T265_10957 [Opisthorchis viverrini]KER20507.1 hypothetical protein T265_10957 [Opisthorchis viverrini]